MPNYRNGAKRLPHPLTSEEAIALLAQTNPRSETGLRNQVALLLMLRAGLRVSEVCHLAPADLDLGAKTLRVHRGKGAKDRVLSLDAQLAERLTLWMARRQNGSRWLLPVVQTGRRGDGTAERGKAMSPRYLGSLVVRLARAANLGRPISPHELRHTYATSELRRGVPISHLQLALGHADLATTSVYLSVTNDERDTDAQTRPAMPIPT